MKRVVSSSLFLLFILIAIAAGLYYFQRYYGITNGKAVNAIPADAAFFFETDVSSGIIKGISKTAYWKGLQSNKFFQKINSSLLSFDSIANEEDDLKNLLGKEKLIISAHVIKANEFDFLFLINLPVPDQEDFADEAIKKISGTDADPLSRSYEDVNIKEVALKDGNVFTYAVSKNIFIGSMTAFLVEDAIRQQRVAGKSFTKDKIFSGIYQKAEEKKTNKILINYRNFPGWLSVFKDLNKQETFNEVDNFANWSVLNPEIGENGIYAEGNSFANDSASYLFHFSAQQPVNMNLFKILPGKTSAVVAVGISDKEMYFESFKKYLDASNDAAANKALLNKNKLNYKFSAEEKFYGITGNEFALAITEPSSVNYENNAYFILKTNNAAKAKKTLQALSILVDKKQNEKTMQEKYNNFSIGLIRLQGLIPALYGDVFKKVNKMYYTFIGDYAVFANQASSIRTLIDYFRSENLLINSQSFKSVSIKLSLNANYFLFCKNPGNSYIIKSALSGLWNHRIDSAKNYLNKWDAFAFSIAEKNKNLKTSCILQYNSKMISSEVSLAWTMQADTSISMKPQVVNNIAGKNHLIMVQDDANNLYLVNNSGTIAWKKQLPEKITGDIFTIDLYKNNTSEFIFNTSNYLFITDMNGNYISNYPIRLPTEATNGLSVFDPDSSLDYRVYIACSNGKIYGYEGSGKPLAGWNFSSNTGIIQQPVESFNINGKNCLVTSDDDGTVFILDRTGKISVKVNEKIIRKPNVKFYRDENPENNFSFATLDTNGTICNILMDGTVKRQTIEAISTSDNFILSHVDGDSLLDYVFIEKDQVTAYTQLLTLIFNLSLNGANADGIETYQLASNKPAIGINSVSSNKLFLINNTGALFKGFPVRGSTPFVIDELNNDGKYYLVAGSEDGNLYVYLLE
ncbi:MAG TPA: hypothetical protein VJY62_02290 [Bacteroidia bacterium]|nr:hypothetical protein [Bacteroidia bacterium]